MPAMTNTEAYAILGLSKKASLADVKSSYKKLALRTHPDKNPNDPDASKKFLSISEAYKRIIDPSSFHDEDGNDEDISEEEMAAMFNMMFSDMFVGGTGGMASRMYEIWGDSDDEGEDEDENGNGLGDMGAMFSMMNMMMNDNEGNFDDEEDYEEGDDENEDYQVFLESMSGSGMFGGGGLSGEHRKNKKKCNTMEKLMASMGLSSGDYHMENIGEEDEYEDDNDDEDARYDAGQIAGGLKKGLTQAQMMSYMQEMLMPSISKGSGSSSSKAKSRSSGNRNVYGQTQSKNVGMAKGLGGEDEDDEEEGCWETDSDDDNDNDYDVTERKAKEGKGIKTGENSSKNTSTLKNAREIFPTIEKIKIPIPTPKPTESNIKKSTIVEVKHNTVGHESVLSGKCSKDESEGVKNTVTFETDGSEKELIKEKDLRVGDRVIVNSRHTGLLHFIGEVHYAKGIFYGVVVDDKSVGKNNGVLKGKEYFRCPERMGLMLRINDLEKI